LGKYLIPSVSAPSDVQTKARRLNRWGGRGQARWTGLVMIIGGFVLLMCVTGVSGAPVVFGITVVGATAMMMFGGLGLVLPSTALPNIHFELTDAKLISLAQDWEHYALKQKDEEKRAAELLQRYTNLRELHGLPEGDQRAARIDEAIYQFKRRTREPVRGYVIVSSAASPGEREVIDRINRRGGMQRELRLMKIAGIVVFLAGAVVIFDLGGPLEKLIAALIAIPGTVYCFYRFYRPLKQTLAHVWCVTNSPEVQLLDKDWRHAIAAMTDRGRQMSADQTRFATLRRITTLSGAHEVEGALATARRQLMATTAPDDDTS
jgi:hypothetical protein